MELHIRDRLSEHLMNSPPVLKKANDQAKYLKGLKEVLYLKRDQAHTRLEEFVTSTVQHLTSLQNDMKKAIDKECHRKEVAISGCHENIMKHIRTTAAAIYQAEGIVEIGQERKLREMGPLLVEELEKLLSKDVTTEEGSVLNHLLFIPNQRLLTTALCEGTKLGFVQTIRGLEPYKVQVVEMDQRPWKQTALVGKEENIVIHVHHTFEENADQFLSVEATSPTGDSLQLEIIDMLDGKFLLSFTPTVAGVHKLNVKLFKAGIPGSPFDFVVLDESSVYRWPQTREKDRKEETKKRPRCPLFLNALEKISRNPPVKPTEPSNSREDSYVSEPAFDNRKAEFHFHDKRPLLGRPKPCTMNTNSLCADLMNGRLKESAENVPPNDVLTDRNNSAFRKGKISQNGSESNSSSKVFTKFEPPNIKPQPLQNVATTAEKSPLNQTAKAKQENVQCPAPRITPVVKQSLSAVKSLISNGDKCKYELCNMSFVNKLRNKSLHIPYT